ncbi:glycylpeptide N-tetradecanoyltransferase 2 isoform X1 [Hydra vulgaris]|nr:glycylpeptide N-tetradecanoyltransferase 2 [Hydra vulgaris]XP_047136290.1 glycylpeptide N-tetradecanoyltransferase 2 [Hydra vulgaris]
MAEKSDSGNGSSVEESNHLTDKLISKTNAEGKTQKKTAQNDDSNSNKLEDLKKKKKEKNECGDDHTKLDNDNNEQIKASYASDIQKAIQKMIISSENKREESTKKKSYAFWETQPVPKLDEVVPPNINEAVEEDKSEIRQEPFTLPAGFVWDTIVISEESQLKELYTLLNENYVEDDDNMFRFDYSPQFLQWALKPPGWKLQWHCGVRVASNKKLVGFISAIPAHIKIYDKNVRMVEINFLCVHKKLRSKRVAPVLIREITRRVNLEGIFQAVYTAGIVLPKPVGTCRYWHRSINPKKLIEVKFSHLRRNMTMQRTIKLYKLPENTKASLSPLTPADLKSAYKIVFEYLKNFQLAPIFTEEEFAHWFLPRDGVISCYVVKDIDSGNVTDLVSFYQLPSTVVDHPKYNSLKAAYSFYNVVTKHDLTSIMNDALILARNNNFDVFNALNLMHNEEFLEKLKFGIGDGNLNYYLYNWKCPSIEPSKTGLVLQ